MIKAKSPRILGVDYGMRRLGLSLSDERKIIALPLYNLECEKKLEQTAQKLVTTISKIEDESHSTIETILMGLPLMMSGKMSLIGDEVKLFVSILEKLTPIPIKLWDERLSTAQAERALREETYLTRKKRTKLVDTVSAVIILQSYLDSLHLNN